MSSQAAQPPNPHFHGSCACARITYTSTSPPATTVACYCTTCRKLSGSSNQTFAHIPASALTLYDNTSSLRYESLPQDAIGGIRFLRLSEFAERAVCADCGTPLAMRLFAWKGMLGVNVGSIDGVESDEVREKLKPEKAIFVGSKPEWIDVGGEGVRICERWDGDGVEEVVLKGRRS